MHWFSIFGKRRFKNTKNYNPLDDDRNDLVKTYFEYIEKIQPKWIIMENVNGILNFSTSGFKLQVFSKSWGHIFEGLLWCPSVLIYSACDWNYVGLQFLV